MVKGHFTKKDIKNFIIYGLNENNIDINSIDSSKIDAIIEDYLFYCNQFKTNYITGELDTFKKAACLLVSINKIGLVPDKTINALIAVDSSQKMCEKPYWNVGQNANIPYKLEEVDFKNLFKNDTYIYQKHRTMLTEAIIFADDKISPLNVYMNLELFYTLAIDIKKQQLKDAIDNINVIPEHLKYHEAENIIEQPNNFEAPRLKKKRKFLFFRK